VNRLSVFHRRLPGWLYPEIVRGEGVSLSDREGKRYLDAAGAQIAEAVVGLGEAINAVTGR
jgi:acetylornithine/succinyldiaminopimelate/putrescine aminotransferase